MAIHVGALSCKALAVAFDAPAGGCGILRPAAYRSAARDAARETEGRPNARLLSPQGRRLVAPSVYLRYNARHRSSPLEGDAPSPPYDRQPTAVCQPHSPSWDHFCPAPLSAPSIRDFGRGLRPVLSPHSPRAVRCARTEPSAKELSLCIYNAVPPRPRSTVLPYGRIGRSARLHPSGSARTSPPTSL